MSSNTCLPSRTVFVLDVSSSMSIRDKLMTLQLSVRRHLADIPLESYVGIVWFCETARTEHEVVKISDQLVRRSLISKLPKTTEYGTDIGAGILEGLAALKRSGLSTEGASILLATDGQHLISDPIYGYNYVAKVLPELLSAKVRVICIPIDCSADPNLDSLTKATNGSIYFANSRNKAMYLRSLSSAMRSTNSSEPNRYPFMTSDARLHRIEPKPMAETICVCNELLQINSGLTGIQVIIDPDIGNNTNFTIESEDFDQFSVSISAPNGMSYQLNSNRMLKRHQMSLNTESGVWTLSLLSHSKQTISANVLVSSASINTKLVRMEVEIQEPTTNSPLIIVAKLLKDSIGVNGAEVTATVERPDGTESQLKLKNFENIYCNYFTDYCGFGRYNVSVSAKSVANVTNLIGMFDTFDGFISPKKVQPFQRQQTVGCFKIEKFLALEPLSDQRLQELALSKSFKKLSLVSDQLTQPADLILPDSESIQVVVSAESEESFDSFAMVDNSELVDEQ